MSLRFSDITVNDYFIDFNGITYQKITESGGSCCEKGFNAIPINTGVSATNQFFANRLIIAQASFTFSNSDSDTDAQFWGEKFDNGANLLNVSGFLFIGQEDGSDGTNVFNHTRDAADIVDFGIAGGQVHSISSTGAVGLNVENSSDRTGAFISTAIFNFPAVDLTSGDLHSIRIAAPDFASNYYYFGCRINGSGGLGIEFGSNTGVIVSVDNYLTNYSGQYVYLSCRHIYDSTSTRLFAKTSFSPLAIQFTQSEFIDITSPGVMAFVPADNNVKLEYWMTMVKPI